MNWLKKSLLLFLTSKMLNKNRLTIVNFNARMAAALKNLATRKKQKETALDLQDKNREKIFKCLIWAILLLKVTLMMMDNKII